MRAGHISKLIHEATPLSALYEMLHRRLSNGSLLPQIVVFQGTEIRFSYMGGRNSMVGRICLILDGKHLIIIIETTTLSLRERERLSGCCEPPLLSPPLPLSSSPTFLSGEIRRRPLRTALTHN